MPGVPRLLRPSPSRSSPPRAVAYQILVDAAREYGDDDLAWGHEIALRSQLERTYASAKGVPVVLLVVQGGPNTLDMMTASAEQGSPLLILSDSGGAATAVSQYCEGGGNVARVTDPAFASLEPKLEALRAVSAPRRARAGAPARTRSGRAVLCGSQRAGGSIFTAGEVLPVLCWRWLLPLTRGVSHLARGCMGADGHRA